MSDHRIPQYLVINRFDDECGHYQRFAAGIDCRLAFVTLPAGLPVIDRSAALDTVVVDSLGHDTLLAKAEALMAKHGPFDGVVGISERDVIATARLRADLEVPGWREDFVRRFKDKPTMKQAVAAAGLRVPAFVALDEGSSAESVAEAVGLPLVLKPRAEAASRGVVVIEDLEELRTALKDVDRADHQCEEYVSGTVLHIDGIRRGGGFHFVSASAYLNTCLDFAHGLPMGSAVIDPGPRADRAVAFTAGCLDALGLDDGPFHLELIEADSGELVFLEVGIRPGGADIPTIHRDLFGIDLFAEAFRVTLGLPPATDPARLPQPRGGGWVAVPEPRPLPSRVVSRTPLLDLVPEVYGEILPEVGRVFTGDGGYDHIGGRFLLRAADSAGVEAAAAEVIRRYRLVAEPAR
ncbi:ATP-grasp domain-containing protein [Streptomyces sp. RB6PN25]|uniref:ATP-grasp domain-containing protein n=1 Tax=Streptomyces humicola TaxID=2953240 RepID=A0ABT1Q0Q8_9ACTN|nr:ATP-grasp domain-containing protein [Streptomyces humicola]MCQ4083502.1 ATP-grasp domain-containing protein [Streptomyces humicola]